MSAHVCTSCGATCVGEGDSPRRRSRRDWRPTFLDILAQSGSVLLAARAAGISRQRCYKARQAEPAFDERWRQAEAEAVERLEVEARRRAMSHSDTLMLGLLRAHKPTMYDPRHRVELTGPEGGPIQTTVSLIPAGLTDHETALLRQAIDRELAARQAGEVIGRLRIGEHVDRADLLLLAAAIEQSVGGEG